MVAVTVKDAEENNKNCFEIFPMHVLLLIFNFLLFLKCREEQEG